MLPQILLTLTATAGGLFGDEGAADAETDWDTDWEDSNAAPIFNPTVRASTLFYAQAAVDTGFERADAHVAAFEIGGRFDLDVELTEWLTAYTKPRFSYVVGLSEDGDTRTAVLLDVPEAHLTFASGRFHVRIGTQVFAWGASDLVAPNDVLNPIDGRQGLFAGTRPEAAKLPVFALESVLGLGPVTLRGVIAPFFTPSRMYLSGWDHAADRVAQASGAGLASLDGFFSDATLDALGDQLLLTDRPEPQPANFTYALRGTVTVGTADISLNAVYGWEPFASFSFDPELAGLLAVFEEASRTMTPINPLSDPRVLAGFEAVNRGLSEGRTLIDGHYERRSVVGLDLIWAVDPIVLKVDVAYTFDRTLYTQDDFRPVRHPWLNAVVGFDYSYEDFQLSFEAFAITVFDVPASYRLILLEPRGLTEGRRDVVLPGAIAFLRHSFLDETIAVEIALVQTFGTAKGHELKDFIARAQGSWSIDDHHELQGGFTFQTGRSDSYGGAHRNNDQVWIGYQLAL